MRRSIGVAALAVGVVAVVAQRISMINGVAQVNVMGGQKYAVRAQVDPSLLAARGIAGNLAAAREQEAQGLMPDGTTRFSMLDGTPIYHYMGCSTFANHTVMPEIALAKVRDDAPFDKICYIGCGVTTGIGAVIFTAKVEAGANVVVFGLGGIGLNVIQGAKMVGADKIIGVDLNPAREAMARSFGMTHFLNPKDIEAAGGNIVDAIVQLTDGGADYSFECVGNVDLMRQALECCHRGWGVSVIIGVAGAGQEILQRIAIEPPAEEFAVGAGVVGDPLGHGVFGQLAGDGAAAEDAGVDVQEFHDRSLDGLVRWN